MRIQILTEQNTHIVKRGENLSSIAKRYNLKWRDIAKINNIKPPRYIIQPGQELKLGVEKQIGGDPDPDTDPIRILASMVAPFILTNISRQFRGGINDKTVDSITAMLHQYHRQKAVDGKASDRVLALLRFKMKSAADGAKTYVSSVLKTKPPEVIDPILKGLGKLGLLNDSALTRIIEAICSVMLDVMMGENSSDMIKSNLGDYAGLYDQYKFEKLPINQSELTKIKQFSMAAAEKDALHAPGARKKARDDFAAKKKLASDLEDKINESQKVFENYFRQNEKITEQEDPTEELTTMVTDAVNDILNALPDEDPAKNRETGLKLMAAIKKELQNPERLASVVDDIAGDLESEISESQK
tara:strand:+ start:1135 stop:2208 length:1074 start_codon:yes stop_codon:yes gene_type:complete